MQTLTPVKHKPMHCCGRARPTGERIQAADMIATDEAADLAGTSRVTVNAWIKAGRCTGVSHLRRGFKLPRWQFEPFVFSYLQPLSQALGTTEGWQLLAFLEGPLPALDGQTPRVALEQGMDVHRLLSWLRQRGTDAPLL